MDMWNTHSAVLSRDASVSSDQPLVSKVGIDILKLGGNAADAVVAMAAVLSIFQPSHCGIGGDINCIFYRKSDKAVLAIHGSGRTGKNATLDKIFAAGPWDLESIRDSNSGLWITVPGAVAGMFDVISQFGSGKLSMEQILGPAIEIAKRGVALPYKIGTIWNGAGSRIMNSRHAQDFVMDDGCPPNAGDVIYAPKLAQCFKDLVDFGPEAFYVGDIASRIIDEVQYAGGVLTLDDMKHHLELSRKIKPSEPLSVTLEGFRLWEMKPNTIGIVALVAINILKEFDLKAYGHNSVTYIHIVTEAIKLAYLECWDYLSDPKYSPGPFEDLLSNETTEKLRSQINIHRAIDGVRIVSGGDTSYVAAVDKDGNGCSFIFSISSLFGSKQIPKDCGFVLNDRAKCMSLNESSPNAYGPKKLSLHTIIPAMLTDSETGDLLAVFGVVGRWMQPQGHVQVLLNMVIFGMDPQTALNQPRFNVGSQNTFVDYKDTLNVLNLEKGIDPSVSPILKSMGHVVSGFKSDADRGRFGRGHVIAHPIVWNKNSSFSSQQVWWAGADPRSDGAAMGY